MLWIKSRAKCHALRHLCHLRPAAPRHTRLKKYWVEKKGTAIDPSGRPSLPSMFRCPCICLTYTPRIRPRDHSLIYARHPAHRPLPLEEPPVESDGKAFCIMGSSYIPCIMLCGT
jgi:hypothetical protein